MNATICNLYILREDNNNENERRNSKEEAEWQY